MVAGSRKEYELLFKLKAALGSDFNSSFSTAINSTKQLQNSLTKINSISGKIDGFKKCSDAVENNKKKLEELKNEHDKLQKEISETEQPSESLRKKLAQNEKQIAATTAKIGEQEKKLNSLGDELKEAGINTDKLSSENEKLKKSYDKLKQSQEDIAKITSAQEKNKAAISETKGELVKTLGVIGGIAAAIYAGPVKSAMALESEMAEVAKVVDWIGKDGTQQQIAAYKDLKKSVLDVTTQIPMTAEEITDIMAAAGQANVAFDNASLVAFTKDAAKMGIAFDTTSAQAGEWMAKWRTSFKMSQEEVVALSDKINYLGNTSAASAAQISTIVTKIGPLGEVAGFASGEIAAMGATLVATGVNEDVAATGIKNVMLAMNMGAAATKKQQAVLESMGFSATDLANRMQKDAKGAIIDLMKAMSKLPEAEQAAALKNFFGKESVQAIAPLLTNLDYLEEQFTKVGDASQYAGSMEAEYAARANTTENKVQLAKNSLSKLSAVLGETFLPYIGQAAEKLSLLIGKVSEFAENNPQAVKTILAVVGGLAGLKVAGLGAKLGFLEMKGGILNVQKVFALFKGNMAKSAADAVTHSGKLATLGKGLSSYFGGIKNSLGGVGGAIGKIFGGGKIATVFSGIGKVISGNILTPLGGIGSKITGLFGGIGGKITSVLGGIGGKIASGPLGKIGGFISKGIGNIGSLFSPLAKLGGSVFGPLTKGIGGMFGGLFGKIMPIIMIVSALSALFMKLSGEDISAFTEPLKQAFEQIKPVLQSVMTQFAELGKQLLPLLMDAAKQLMPLFGQIVTAILPVLLQLIESLVPLIIQVVQQILPVILNLITQLAPLFTQIITAILPVIVQLLEILLPIITQLITAVLPVIVQILNAILPIIIQLVEAILPVLMSILQALMPVIQFLADLFANVLGVAIQAISGIINGLMQILQGIIDFVVGVFSGNWKQAWEGIKSIFSGIWESIKNICKGVVNGIISIVNGIIGGLNKLKIPDWVPGLGGKGINIPLIPMLAKGSNYSPETFIAGEKGAELVTNAKGRKVFTAAQTGKIFKNMDAAQETQSKISESKQIIMFAPALQALLSSVKVGAGGGLPIAQMQEAVAARQAPGINAPTVTAETTNQSTTVTIHNSPTIVVDGKKPDDLDEKLKRNNQDLLNQVDERIRKKEEDERRSKYD